AYLQHCKTGRPNLAVLGAGTAAYADSAHQLAVEHDRQAALDGRGARQLHTDGSAAAHSVLQRFRRTFEPHRRGGLFLRYDQAADLRSVHALQVDEMSAIVDHADYHGP